MLTLPFAVPEAALTNREAVRLARLTREAGGFWLRAADGTPDRWAAATDGGVAAVPAAEVPRFVLHAGRMALELTPNENRGFRLPDAVPDARRWSAAVLWTGDEPAQALLAVRPERGGNPVHLSETAERELIFRDDANSATATLPSGGKGWRLTVVACAGDRLRLSDGKRTVAASGLDVPEGPAQLLVGCRSQGARMRKTLGAARIAELWFWPGLDILSDPAAPLGRALDDFRQWEA